MTAPNLLTIASTTHQRSFVVVYVITAVRMLHTMVVWANTAVQAERIAREHVSARQPYAAGIARDFEVVLVQPGGYEDQQRVRDLARALEA